jgi:hypothetical protein
MNNNGAAPYETRLFRLRLWQEPIDANSSEWRGQITCVQTGRVCSFRTWAQLIAALDSLTGGAQRQEESPP